MDKGQLLATRLSALPDGQTHNLILREPGTVVPYLDSAVFRIPYNTVGVLADSASSSEEDADEPSGRMLEDETEMSLIRFLGKGKFGMVYLGLWKGAHVAVKVLPREVDRKLLKREITSLALLRHPNIVTFYYYESNRVGHFIVNEYISGGNVRHKLDDKSFEFSNILKVSWLRCCSSQCIHTYSSSSKYFAMSLQQ